MLSPEGKYGQTVTADGFSVQMLDENRNTLAEKCLVAVLEDE